MGNTPQLGIEPIPQIAWWKQNVYSKSKKPMDKMPIAEIIKLYESGFILCDDCGCKMKITDVNYSLVDHVVHLINDRVK